MRQTQLSSAAVSRFKFLDAEELRARKSPNEWNILECIEHLNRYGSFYLPEIETQILKQCPIVGDPIFKGGILGNYFVRSVSIGNWKPKKMKAPKEMDPLLANIDETVLLRFLKQQDRLLDLLDQAVDVDLVKTKTAISLTPYIRLRLGDTLRFMVAHIDRHVRQAARTQY